MWSADLSLCDVVLQHFRNSQVSNLDDITLSNEDVHGFDVSVHDLLVVQVLHTLWKQHALGASREHFSKEPQSALRDWQP